MSQALARKVSKRKDNGKPQNPPLEVLKGGKGKSRFPDHSAWRLDGVDSVPESRSPVSKQAPQDEGPVKVVRESGLESDGTGATVLSMDNYGPKGTNAFGWGKPMEKPAKKTTLEKTVKGEKPPAEKSSNMEAGFSPMVEGLATM